jgi:N-methylhydantoinase A
LLLGYLDENSFLGGKMKLDRKATIQAIKIQLAEPLGISLEEAAWGVHETVTANMAQAATIHAIERGLDATRFAMLPIGGAGPVHACSMAKKMGISRMVCPAGAGVASAIGMLAAAISFEIGRAAPCELALLNYDHAASLLHEMADEASSLIISAGADKNEVTQDFSVMMRYLGQGYEIEVSIVLEMIENHDGEGLLEQFSRAYRNRYGRSEDMHTEILSWRLAVTGPRSTLGDTLGQQKHEAKSTPTPRNHRPVWFENGYVETPVYKRSDFFVGSHIDGPAIIEETESTLVLPIGFKLDVDAARNLILETTT